tara:strand:- start:1438 stop:3519 length:2082 start_codon:yes stop_codon:yes gene_type:complete
MENVIQLEIAQRDSETVFSNGDFINHLAVPVVLEEGDQIVLNKTFIDTTVEDSGLIDIDQDITVKLGVLPYVTAEVPNKFDELGGVTTNIPQDNVDYFPLRIQSNKNDPNQPSNFDNIIVITEIAFFMDTYAEYPNFGAVNKPLIIYYYDINDNYTEIPFNIPYRKTRGTGYGDVQIFPVNIVALDKLKQNPTRSDLYANDGYRNGLGIHWNGAPDQRKQPKYLSDLWQANGTRAETMTTAQMNSYNSDGESAHGGFGVTKQEVLKNEVDVAASLEVDLFTLDIKQGKYTPLEMTTLLNNAFIQNSTTNQFSYGNILESVFLKYSIPYIAPPNTPALTKSGMVFRGDSVFVAGTGNNRTKNHILVSNSGSPNVAIDVDNTGRSVGYNPPLFTTLRHTFVLGTDSMEIEYDDETSLFYWKQLHHSIYDPDGGAVVTQVSRRIIADQPNPFTYFIRSKAGGVCFTSMYACLQSDSAQSYDFWNGKLGFNVAKMTVSDTNGGIDDYKEVDIGGVKVVFSSPKMIDGIHTTNAVNTIDGLTKKTGNLYRQIPAEPAVAGDESTLFPSVQSNNNIVIFAETSTVNNIEVIRPETNSGYYLIEMIAGFNNTMVSSTKTEKNIHGIVNRYFNRNSYTSSTEQDSLVYTHRGAPLILSSIRSRILLPNRSVPSNIGEDNTIFLQVIKAQQPQQPPQPPPKK